MSNVHWTLRKVFGKIKDFSQIEIACGHFGWRLQVGSQNSFERRQQILDPRDHNHKSWFSVLVSVLVCDALCSGHCASSLDRSGSKADRGWKAGGWIVRSVRHSIRWSNHVNDPAAILMINGRALFRCLDAFLNFRIYPRALCLRHFAFSQNQRIRQLELGYQLGNQRTMSIVRWTICFKKQFFGSQWTPLNGDVWELDCGH